MPNKRNFRWVFQSVSSLLSKQTNIDDITFTKTLPESQVKNTEDDISLFFTNKEVPNIFETPLELGEIASSINID